MKLDVFIEADDEKEQELMDRMVAARRFALEEADLDTSEAAALFAQFATGLAVEEDAEEQEDEANIDCPSCGAPMDGVESPGIGENPTVNPCGCEIEWEDVPENFLPE